MDDNTIVRQPEKNPRRRRLREAPARKLARKTPSPEALFGGGEVKRPAKGYPDPRAEEAPPDDPVQEFVRRRRLT